MERMPLPRLGFLRGVFLANHLASTDNLNQNNQKAEHIPTKTNNTEGALINNNTIYNVLRYKADRTWFSQLLRHPASGAVYSYNSRVHIGPIAFQRQIGISTCNF